MAGAITRRTAVEEHPVDEFRHLPPHHAGMPNPEYLLGGHATTDNPAHPIDDQRAALIPASKSRGNLKQVPRWFSRLQSAWV